MKKITIEVEERLSNSTIEAVELTLRRLINLGFVKTFKIGDEIAEVSVSEVSVP